MAVNGVDQEVMDVRSTHDKSQPIDIRETAWHLPISLK